MFIDQMEIYVKAGDGGSGAVSFRREKYVPRGGPDGGEGGRGGSVIIKADKNIKTLVDFYYRPQYKAGRGGHGQGNNCSGKSGEDIVMLAPLGTMLYNMETGDLLCDLVEKGQEFLIAKGGRGGKGNAHFATSTRQAPRFSQKGEPGEEYKIRLDLKLIAEVGIIGLPNAGKSTLLSRISKAKPKIANYPFTTLFPNLGVVDLGDGFSFVVADMPGLIDGAALGEGLGDKFLRHIQRTKILVHLIDLSNEEEGRNFQSDYESIIHELGLFDPMLLKKKQIVVGNKIDMPRAKEILPKAEKFFKRKKIPFLTISGVSGEGLKDLIKEIVKVLKKNEK
ncbi:MAG: GTPase ObgE [bacterium]|nr:GTPase ObgE [bacterium]